MVHRWMEDRVRRCYMVSRVWKPCSMETDSCPLPCTLPPFTNTTMSHWHDWYEGNCAFCSNPGHMHRNKYSSSQKLSSPLCPPPHCSWAVYLILTHKYIHILSVTPASHHTIAPLLHLSSAAFSLYIIHTLFSHLLLCLSLSLSTHTHKRAHTQSV